MTKESKPLAKGYGAEELLRRYFLTMGYFVVRGVPVVYDNFDVTDIDLWLYHRHSPVSRERVNVDIKNKKTPQAIERIFWTRGIKETLGLERCIVATTDSRPAVVQFGREHDVLVLDGKFLENLKGRFPSAERLSEEALIKIVNRDGLGKMAGDWAGKLRSSKGRLVHHLNFDGCNRWLEDTKFFMEASLTDQQRCEAAVRSTYLTLSYFLIGLDYSLAGLAFDAEGDKRAALAEGFSYGSEGKGRTEAIVGIAAKLAARYAAPGSPNARSMTRELLEAAGDMRVGILAEFFAKPLNINRLFPLSRQLEGLAYSVEHTWPSALCADLKSQLAVLLDFFGIDRSSYFALPAQQPVSRTGSGIVTGQSEQKLE